MPSTEDDRDVKRLKAVAQSLISTLQTKRLADLRVLRHFEVEKTDTRGWHAIFAEWPISKAKLDLWFDKSQGGSQRHFWVGFWTRGKAPMNNIVLNAPRRFAPTLHYGHSDWKPVGPSYQLKTVKKDHGSEPICEYYAREGCYFGLAETSKRGDIDLGRVSDFICKVIRAADAASFENYMKEFENKVRKSLGDPADLRRRRLSNAPRLPKSIVRRVREFVRNADVVAEVLFRAQGNCGSCKNSAPFTRDSDKTPYLEVHHKKQLSAGGEDTVENAIALCPNCHRKAHFG